MQYTDARYRLRVTIESKECSIPDDELARMQGSLDRLGEVARDFPGAGLWINVIRHPRSRGYRGEARLKVPGKTFVGGDEDGYLDTAFQRCVRKLTEKAGLYRANPNRAAEEQARRLDHLNNNIVAPEDPADG